MGDAVEVVHRAVQGVDNPLAIPCATSDAFFAEDGVVGVAGEDVVLDEALGAAVEFEFDVMGLHGIDLERLFEIFAEKFSGEEGGVDGRGEELGHAGRCGSRCGVRGGQKKSGGDRNPLPCS
jgi:hypothetical protein